MSPVCSLFTKMASVEKRIRGALLALLLFLSSALGIMFLPGWFLPVAFLCPWVYRIIADIALSWWFYYACVSTALN